MGSLEIASNRAERPKLPIPRWKRPKEHDFNPQGSVEKKRVSQACEPCRAKKSKCDGERPSCHYCLMGKIECYFGDGTRERVKKNLHSLENRAIMLENLIKSLEPFLDSAGRFTVMNALTQSPPYSPYTTNLPTVRENTHDLFLSRHPGVYDGETFVSVGVGLKEPQDYEIGTPISNPSEYMGENNGVTCVDRMSERLEKADVPIAGQRVDMFDLPPKDVADRLVELYFDTVHPLFPIIYKPLFMKKYDDYYKSQKFPSGENLGKWLAILNLVFAIGETYPKPELEIPGERRDMEYFMKSRVLSALDGEYLLETPDLGRVQTLGLTGMYLLASVQTNRAWSVVGLAIRFAQGIGLHLRNDNLVDKIQNEMSFRTWYCLCCLETNLCLITERPCAIQDRHCSAPCPADLNNEMLSDEHQEDSTLDTYFSGHRHLMLISAEVLDVLYSAHSRQDKSLMQLQQSILDFSVVLEHWRMSLPFSLDFMNNPQDCIYRRQKLNLALQHYSILMLINRPCFYLMDGHIPNESPESTFSKRSAATCVSAARAIIHLIADEQDPSRLVKNSPWWCLLHYLMPAKAIIILGLDYHVVHTSQNGSALFADAKMILGWLKTLSKINVSLQKYSIELADQLKKVAPRFGEYWEDHEPNITFPFATDHNRLSFQYDFEELFPETTEGFHRGWWEQ